MIFYNKSKWGLLGVNEYISKRVNEYISKTVNQEEYALINAYTHKRIYPTRSTIVESIRQIGSFLQNEANPASHKASPDKSFRIE
jgi:hypothetical protein